MRTELQKMLKRDSRIYYRGESPSRLDNLTDAVFGIAITLLIFNVVSTESFDAILQFTKTLPAFMISVGFLILIWYEHAKFAEMYSLQRPHFIFLNTLFIALVIFYVYPLKFLTLFLTVIFFGLDIPLSLNSWSIPNLTIYYGIVVFALYFVLFLFYLMAYLLRESLVLSPFELFHTRQQMLKLAIMFGVPVISVSLILILQSYSVIWSSTIGGFSYFIYSPLMFWWQKQYHRQAEQFPKDENTIEKPAEVFPDKLTEQPNAGAEPGT